MILTWLLHAVYSTVFAFLLANAIGHLSVTVAALSLVLGTWLALRHAKSFHNLHSDFRFSAFSHGDAGKLEIALFAFVLYAAWRHFTWMLFPIDHSLATLSANNFGDLPLHINYIRALAGGIEFPPKNPIFTSELLRYPYGVDLYNALWEVLGIRLEAHLLFTGLLATMASLIFLRAFGGWWAVGAFFLSGGSGVWTVVRAGRLIDFQAAVDWKNLFLAVFITQRGFLFALPVGLWILLSLRRHFSGERPLSKTQQNAIGLAWGFFPFFHLHSFLILSLFIAACAFEQRRLAGLKELFKSRAFYLAFLPALLLIGFSTEFLQKAGVMHWHFGWMLKTGSDGVATFMGLGPFLALNFGAWLFVPLVLAILIHFSKGFFDAPARRRMWLEYTTYSLAFLLFFNLMLAPWAWDNIKLLIWPYLGFARLLYLCLEPRLIGRRGAIVRWASGVILLSSGTAAVAWTLRAPPGMAVPIYHIGQLASTEGALAAVPKDAVFASSTSHQHVLTYFGRMRVAGYEGHLMSHGIDPAHVLEKLTRIMDGDSDYVQLARELGVTHIFWGPDERIRFGERERPWMTTLKNVSRVPGYEIYAVK